VRALPDDVTACFSESNGRYVVEVPPERAAAFESLLSGCPVARIGIVTAGPDLLVRGLANEEVIRANIGDLERAWQGHLAAPSQPAPGTGRVGENR